MKHKLSKILIAIAIILLGLVLGTSVKAYTVYSTKDTTTSNGYFIPHQIGDDWTVCVEHGNPYKANFKDIFGEDYLKYFEGYTTDEYCEQYDIPPQGFAETILTMDYEQKEKISPPQNQDLAYILTFSKKPYTQAETQYAVWTTELNAKNKGWSEVPNELASEAAAFKVFYESFHDEAGTNKFNDYIKDNTDMNNIEVGVDSANGYYVVGPFNVSYPNGQYNGTNKFSWIDEITGITQDGSNVAVEIIDSNNQTITKEQIGKDGNVSLNNTNFYIKFYSKTATNIKLKIKFGYLESCYAEMYQYEGTRYLWYWETQQTGHNCDWTNASDPHYHGYEHPNDNEVKYCNGVEQNGVCNNCGSNAYLGTGVCMRPYIVEKPCTHKKTYASYNYVLKKTPSGSPQKVLHVKRYFDQIKNEWTYANPNYGNAEITLGLPNGVDLTMDIAGYAWLDKDNGKVNEGDSLLNDLNSSGNIGRKDEVLPGVEVWLYQYNGENDPGTLKAITLTDGNGHYSFTKLNSQYKYYVKFVYNGMMYDNVKYNMSERYNSEQWNKTSKAQEVDRQIFNNKFAHIGSYPENYKITNKMFDNIGEYNIAFPQEEIEDIFRELSKVMAKNGDGNLKRACEETARNMGNNEITRRKVQFAADCRMMATTDKTKIKVNGADIATNIYPVYDRFNTTSITDIQIGNVVYKPIYPGQRYINYGIKARETVDLALYKDVSKATVSINGKLETYNYGLLQQPTIGVNESDYLQGLRNAYRATNNADNNYKNNNRTREIENDTYNLNTRTEEVTNGGSFNNKNDKITDYNLSQEDKLNIEVTYKIEIVNQSSTRAAITEVVDYYDNNYEFASAYVGNEKGEFISQVEAKENSMYSTQYKSNKGAYKTIYLKPTQETKLGNGEKQYIYVTLRLVGQNKAGDLLSQVLKNDKDTLLTMNLAEINGYKTYNKDNDNTPGLVDIDSNPGNLNISNIEKLTDEAIMGYPNIRDMYEDDTRRAPAMIFKLYDERSISGTVFEDNTDWNDKTIHTKETRKGNGKLDDKDTKINGAIVELVEIKNGNLITRAQTTTQDGAYSFAGFLPGNYVIRYTYGSNDATAMQQDSIIKGLNSKSYNGQDYQSTQIGIKEGKTLENDIEYITDETLKNRYNYTNIDKTKIDKYYNNGDFYWYTIDDKLSDASDDANRTNEIIKYSKAEEGKEIINHKAEVFNAYVNPQPKHITQEQNRNLANELEGKTHRYAYTPEIEVEVEYATKETSGTKQEAQYAHNITGVDFGIVERPRAELVIDQDIAKIKVLAADGTTVLFDTTGPTSNLQWISGQEMKSGLHYQGGKIDGYDKQELVNIIMDEELISGAKLEVTYKFTVTNNSEEDNASTTRAKTIINYVSNNLDFDASDERNKAWKVVKTTDVQTNKNSSYISNANIDNKNIVDLSTQSVILQSTTDANTGLTKTLKPGESTSAELVLTKVLSAESTVDDLTYTNLSEIVEIDNTVGRYDHGAIPGNQSTENNPAEHDASGSSKYDTMRDDGNTPGDENPPDGVIIITPPTGSTYIYYTIGIASAIILAAGIYLIKRFIIDRK